jgi:hypothetical protein
MLNSFMSICARSLFRVIKYLLVIRISQPMNQNCISPVLSDVMLGFHLKTAKVLRYNDEGS